MIGWLAAGAWLHLEGVAARRRKDARRAERARKRRESPMPNAVWVAYGIVLVAAVASPPALPGMLLIGVGIWWYAKKRRAEHEAWMASRPVAPAVDFAGRAAMFDREGMPQSAEAMRDLERMRRGF